MAGDDEARARAALIEMQTRLAAGPRSALGVPDSPSPEQIRSAFLALTKQFHPARFGRMTPELQKLSNEVFLGIKSAHDTLQRASGARPLTANRSGAMPLIPPESSRPTSTASMPPPRRTPTPAMGVPTTPPPGTPSSGVPTKRPPMPGATLDPSTVRGTGLPRGANGFDEPAKAVRQSGAMPLISSRRTPTPAMGVPTAPPPGTPSSGVPTKRPPTPGATLDPSTVRGTGVQGFDEAAELKHAMELVAARSWGPARQALHALAARVPQSKPYRALLCYTRGREAQASGRPDEAALEFQRALQLDPQLAQAKQALTEVQRRR